MSFRPITPFFHRHATRLPPRGRLLLVSYHFPPAETAGALRWQQLSHHALRRGFALDVITRDPGRLDDAGENILARLPDGIRLFGVPDRALLIARIEKRLLSLRRRLRERFATRSAQARSAAPEPPASLGRDEITFDPTSLKSWLRAYDAA